MEAEREMTRLWRTFRTVYELLADRVGTPDRHILRGNLLAGVAARYQTLRSPVVSPMVSLG
jgi:hypothetical protein